MQTCICSSIAVAPIQQLGISFRSQQELPQSKQIADFSIPAAQLQAENMGIAVSGDLGLLIGWMLETFNHVKRLVVRTFLFARLSSSIVSFTRRNVFQRSAEPMVKLLC